MIVGIAWKGAGILVAPVVALPLFACAIGTNILFPGQPTERHMWLPGTALMVSAVTLFLLNRHLKQGARPPDRPAISGEYARYARKQTIESENSKVRSTGRFSAENDTGWFMLIPTGIWPFIIGAMGFFLIVGDVVESAAKPAKSDISVPAK